MVRYQYCGTVNSYGKMYSVVQLIVMVRYQYCGTVNSYGKMSILWYS